MTFLISAFERFRWQDVSQLVREKLSILQPLAFSYFDDEGDIIFVSASSCFNSHC